MAIEGLGRVAAIAEPLALAKPAAAGAADVERFQQAMASEPAASAVPSGAASQVQPAGRSETLGDAILNTLESSSTQVKNAWASAGQALDRPDLRMTDMLKLQMTVLEASIQYDLISKGISKANQGLDQLLRTQ